MHVLDEFGEAATRLLSVDGLGGDTLELLVDRAGSVHAAASAIMCGDASQWLPGRGCELLREQMEQIDVSALQRSAERSGAGIMLVTDDCYPVLLRALPVSPGVLWLRGTVPLGCAGAIVGARRCTEYGRVQAARCAGSLSVAGVTTVSGGARGIDAAAHRGALRAGGATIAVLGSGHAVPYPPEHETLFDAIVEEGGCVMSEFRCDREPRPGNFPRRNRIIAGLSAAVGIMEAAWRSGALITARIAVEDLGRDALAVPGRVDAPASGGCIRALREGWAGVLSDPSDLVEACLSSVAARR
ncbi:MAG: DNA-processing protein DprA [Phycisphaerales bacterium]|nr:DNA-processing protein DprA [Phycisphaerales bacterium]